VVILYYGEDLCGLEMLLPPEVMPCLHRDVIPKLSAIETLSNSHNEHNGDIPGVYRRVPTPLPADMGTAALLFGVAESIDGYMQSHGMKLGAKQYYEEVVRMAAEATQAIDQAGEGINAFFDMLATYEPLARGALGCVEARLAWHALDEEKRLCIRHSYGLFELTVSFLEHIINVFEGKGE
jgi:hypothetical protein